MKEKGFTLIELLAVIVILAIVSLIAIPLLLNVIEKARKGSAESSAMGYIDAVEKQVMINNVKTDERLLIKAGEYTKEELDAKGVKIKGEINDALVVVNEKGKVVEGTFHIDGYLIEYDGKEAKARDVENKSKENNNNENNENNENNDPVEIDETNENLADCVTGKYYSFNYTGSVQSFTSKCSGRYKLEVWGAQGGGDYPGYGGYSVGTYSLSEGETLYVYVGGQGSGTDVETAGGAGYNGAGQGYNGGAGGGGMTHISKTSTDNPKSVWKKTSHNTLSSITEYQSMGTGTVTFSDSTTATRTYKLAKSAKATSDGTAFCYTTDYTLDPYCKLCVGGTADSYCVENDDASYNDLTSSYNCFAKQAVTKGQMVYCYISGSGTEVETKSTGTAKWNLKVGYASYRTTYTYSSSASGKFDTNADNLIIVAGGGGGSTTSNQSRGGDAGGFQSGPVKVSGTDKTTYIATQTSGYKKGTGGSANSSAMRAGAGSGWYGGKTSASTAGGAGGGSGWIQNAALLDKHMTCYNCPTSDEVATKTQVTTSVGHAVSDAANTGNGHAKITYLGA